MDDQDLTSPEHVEQLADSYVIPGMPEDCRPVIVAATLRALAAKLDATEADLIDIAQKGTRVITELEARVKELEDCLKACRSR